MIRYKIGNKCLFKFNYALSVDFVKKTVDTSKYKWNLMFNWKGSELRLLLAVESSFIEYDGEYTDR